jgi:hypothetical protein
MMLQETKAKYRQAYEYIAVNAKNMHNFIASNTFTWPNS